ncbi:response regulator [Colwellia sp. PAMC 21821]|uniref:ATP-binding response regulator n=1 Tax=Colwellia sp. PAMC 21821 TaxID=1816219 RepID=UPI0009BF7326|nr:response regulator [Colwellia sp. PAMC 21821]ARD44270.1 hybrid sensor histidine kinase/response regulator [Colwellia sp. PAMC 21821]
MSKKFARVLLVEDDEDDYILTSDHLSQLESHSFEIDWVTNPNEALEQLNLGKHDICLLDYQLGAYNGLTVLEKASKSGCIIPIIMLTGQSDDTLDQSALAAGAVDYLVKGDITTSRFARAIRYALARQEIENERVERINAETQNQSKDRFLAHLSHELRTPLTSILGYTEILLNGNKAPNAESELNIILNNGQHLLGLLNNVLDLSKIAVGKLEYNFCKINLDSFIADIFCLMQVHAADKALKLVMRGQDPLPLVIHSDPLRLRQVLINLIHNGIKFTEQGQVELTLWTELIDNKEILSFKVSDNGQGIPEDMLDNIFKPFEQVEDYISRKEQGAGLGLSICAELIKHMGGTIQVQSLLNKGSDFTFSIDPGNIAGQERALLDFEQEHSLSENLSLAKLRGHVLVVDDIDDIRLLIGRICQSFGLKVTYASNGIQAIEKFKLASSQGWCFDLALMDIHMPKLDGKRAIKELKALGFDQPILAVTAATMKGVKQELLTLGFNQIVAKPINKTELHQNLANYLKLENPAKATLAQPSLITDNKLNSKEQSTQRIIVVEDDADAADVTVLLLKSLGIEAVKAQTAKQCQDLLKNERNWTKILLDLHLPDANGLDLASSIKQSHPDITLILVSGATVTEQKLRQAGIDKAILKPINIEILKSLR